MNGRRECDSCGHVYRPASHDQCPECGSTAKVDHVTITSEEQVTMQDAVSIDMENVLTGRFGRIYHSEENTIHEQVKEFVERLVNSNRSFDNLMSNSEVAKQVASECQAAKKTGFTGTYYRGRGMDRSSPPPVDKVTSPPVDKVTDDGRYHRADEHKLYISCTERTAHIESTPNDSETVWLIEFDITQPELTYIHLDTDFEDDYPHLHHLLLLSEILPEKTDTGRAYRPTHFLRHICTQNQISAIEFPSIRAEYSDNPSAVNVAVFGEWIDKIENQVVRDPYKSPNSN